MIEERIQFEVAGQLLEGVLAYPDQGRPAVSLLLLSPHPHLGGNMDNNVIRALAQLAAEGGCLALRFNYRGVGGSDISLPENTSLFDYWAGIEEGKRYDALLPDALGAWQALQNVAGDLARSVLLGYSLGAVLAGLVMQAADADAVIAISPPVARVPLDAYQSCLAPKHFVSGDDDFAFTREAFDPIYARLPDPKTYTHLAGSDHFFRKDEEKLYNVLGHVLHN